MICALAIYGFGPFGVDEVVVQEVVSCVRERERERERGERESVLLKL